jgi:hypothetical protein
MKWFILCIIAIAAITGMAFWFNWHAKKNQTEFDD